MKLLKFRDFVNEFINESSKNPKWVDSQKSAYDSWIPNGRWITPKAGEILRADLGSGEPEDQIKQFMSLSGISPSAYEITKGNYSGKFDSWALKFNQDVDFHGKLIKKGERGGIVNAIDTSKGVVQVIGDKDLTPDKLGLSGTYQTQNSIITAAKSAIKGSIKVQEYQDFCCELIDAVSKYKTVFNTVDDVEGVNREFQINHDFSRFNSIDAKSIKAIEKDFGEILGGIFMFNLIKDTGSGLTFPKESNLELIDFFFNGLAISSKAGKGAKASATGYINAINRSMQIAKWIPTPEEKEVIERVLKPLSEEAREKTNTKYLKKSKNSGIFSSTVNLFNIHLTNKRGGWDYFISESKLNPKDINRDDIIQFFIDLKGDGKLKKFVNEFFKITSLGLSERGKTAHLLAPLVKSSTEEATAKALDRILEEEMYDILIGIILYGCSKELQKVINSTYSDTLTSIINKSLTVKQLYLDTKIGKNLINFTIKAMENSDFEIGTLNGIESWNVKSITVSMKK